MRLFLSILILHLSKVLATQVPTVEIENGNVSGVLDKSFSGFDYFAYMGIPYAESPTDDLRFQVNFLILIIAFFHHFLQFTASSTKETLEWYLGWF